MSNRFDRDAIEVKPLSERMNKLDINRDLIEPKIFPVDLSEEALADIRLTAAELCRAKELGAARILAFGAHSIKNGLASVLIGLMEGGWVTHFATNGAGVIHDWEFAFQGRSGEDVRRYTSEGQFGIWSETGRYLNLAIIVGAYNGLGYGESVATMIDREGIEIPDEMKLRSLIIEGSLPDATEETVIKAAAAADLLATKKHFELPDGFMPIPHPFKEFSIAYRAKIGRARFTCHPMFGHDIIYTHPINKGAAIGRAAEYDFLSYAESVSHLQGGVYLSVGSAVMSPMIFEKSLSMSRNLARQKNEKIDDFSIHVVDLAKSTWDWNNEGEPPMDNPAYYLRFCKTFSRMGGRMSYCSADNRSWLVALLRELRSIDGNN